LELADLVRIKPASVPPFKILFIGDIVGDDGLRVVEKLLPDLLKEHEIDFCIANGENAHEGKGINEYIVRKLYKAGVNVITGGDHSFDKHLIFPYMQRDRNLLRPMNYPKGVPGFGFGLFDCPARNTKVGVINIRGQAFFHNPIRCPFAAADIAIDELYKETRLIFVDFHAEASAEKYAMAYYLDGRVSVLAGTHTHVQTADEKIFPQGMGYITDVGFTGPHDSVIGMDVIAATNRFLLQTPQKYMLGKGNPRLNGAIFTLNMNFDQKLNYGNTIQIERLNIGVELPVTEPTTPTTTESKEKEAETPES
jgi:metallophosphoesterase (TIGR00282 family)